MTIRKETIWMARAHAAPEPFEVSSTEEIVDLLNQGLKQASEPKKETQE